MLSQLIRTEAAPPAHTVVRVPLDRVLDNPYQHRRRYDPATLNELAQSIISMREQLPATSGLQQPPLARLVRRAADGTLRAAPGPFDPADPALFVQLIIGHRRYRAFDILAADDNPHRKDYATFPVVFVEVSDADLWQHAITENSQRDDVSAIEEAELLQRAMAEFGYTTAEVGALFGWSRPTVANKLRLLDLPDEYRAAMIAGEISETSGRALLGLAKAPHLLAQVPPSKAAALPRRDLEQEIRRIVTRLVALPPAPGTGYMTFAYSWSEEPSTEKLNPPTWAYDWAPEPAVEGIVGPCAACRWRMTFAGDGGPRCAQPRPVGNERVCYALKTDLWRAEQAAAQAAVLAERAAAQDVSRETPAAPAATASTAGHKPASPALPADVVQRTSEIHLFRQGDYYAPAELVEKGLCSQERCECWRVVYSERASDENIRPDPEHAPNLCLGCASESRLQHRKRELEEGPGYMAARKAAAAASADAEARVRDALATFTADELWHNRVFLDAVVAAGTLSDAFSHASWSLETLQERIWMHAAKHRCTSWSGTRPLWRADLVDVYFAELRGLPAPSTQETA